MTTFFPVNEYAFIEFTIRHWRAIGGDWTDALNSEIDNDVSNNSDEENIMIINEYAGGLFEAIELYKEHFDGFDYDSKQNFYAKLAYISMYHKFYDIIKQQIDEEEEEEEDDE